MDKYDTNDDINHDIEDVIEEDMDNIPNSKPGWVAEDTEAENSLNKDFAKKDSFKDEQGGEFSKPSFSLPVSNIFKEIYKIIDEAPDTSGYGDIHRVMLKIKINELEKNSHSQKKVIKDVGTLSNSLSGDTKQGGINSQDDTKLQLERSASLPVDNQLSSDISKENQIKLELLRELNSFVINTGKSNLTKTMIYDFIDKQKEEINKQSNNE